MRNNFFKRVGSAPLTLKTVRDEVTAVAINTAVISSLASLVHTELPPVGQIHSREACETALDNNRGLLYDLEAARCSFNLFVVVDGVPPELDAAGDIHSRGDSAGVTAAAGCNHTLFLVIDRWDDDAEVEEAGGRNQACDIAEGCAQKNQLACGKMATDARSDRRRCNALPKSRE